MTRHFSFRTCLSSLLMTLGSVAVVFAQGTGKAPAGVGFPVRLNTELISETGAVEPLTRMLDGIADSRSRTSIEDPRRMEIHIDSALSVKEVVPVLCAASNWAFPLSLYTDIELPIPKARSIELKPNPNRLTLFVGAFEEEKAGGGESDYYPKGDALVVLDVSTFDRRVAEAGPEDIVISPDSRDSYSVGGEVVEIEKLLLKWRPRLMKTPKVRRSVVLFIDGGPANVRFGAVRKVANLIAKHRLGARLHLVIFDPDGGSPCN